MDVEIVKKNGRKYRLSNYGVVKDFVVSSIDREVVRDSVDGRPGSLDYGVIEGDRSISVPFIFKSKDLHDYAHLRDELYSLLGDNEPFYIREMRRPKTLQYDFVSFGKRTKWSPQTGNEYVNGKQYLVRLDNTISPNQEGLRGEVSLEFVTSGLPYAESVFTTVDIHDLTDEQFTQEFGSAAERPSGTRAIYKTKGESLVETINISNYSFENSFVSSSDGSYSTGGRFIANPKLINITPGIRYTFEDTGTANNLSNWWLYFYDDNGEFLSSTFTSKKTLSFTPKGTKMRIMAEPSGSASFSPQDIGASLKPRLKYTSGKQVFTIYNGGNVSIEPEFMFLEITIGMLETTNVFTVKNRTTGDVFEWKKPVSGRNIYLKGMNISEGTAFNGLRETNRKFIRLAPGVNRFEVWGGSFSTITFNTKFYYK